MRKISKYLMALLVATTFFACEEELVKSDFDVAIDASKTPVVATSDLSKVSASYAVLKGTATGEVVDKGFLVSTDAEFTSPVIIATKDGENGNFELKAAGLNPLTTYYAKAFATSLLGGTAFGEVKTFKTREGFNAFSISALTATIDDWSNAGFDDIDMDGDGNSWKLSYYNQDAGQVWMISASWASVPLTPNNYLLFPEMNIAGVDGVLTIKVQGADPDYPKEKFKVIVSDAPITADNAANAEVLFTHTLADAKAFTKSVEVPAKYEGKKVYMALVHFDSTDNYQLGLISASFDYAK